MSFLLLTGAGFSRNWGGWLATEAFEYLLGCPEIGNDLRALIWKSKRSGGGFEDALAELQRQSKHNGGSMPGNPLKNLQDAIVGMFNEMNNGFDITNFEPQNDLNFMVRTFLNKFDVIFTLNQDLLLERHYLDANISSCSNGKWDSWQIPGMKPLHPQKFYDPILKKKEVMTPDLASMEINPRLQPYFKLHGSSNWVDGEAGGRLLIMGGNKAVEIDQYPVLTSYHKTFREYLARTEARLMIIGYSFSDSHINEAIEAAVTNGNLKLFIIDPMGVDVLDKQNPRAPIRVRSELMELLEPRIVGASRRSLTSIFSNDRVEHGKIMRFFTP